MSTCAYKKAHHVPSSPTRSNRLIGEIKPNRALDRKRVRIHWKGESYKIPYAKSRGFEPRCRDFHSRAYTTSLPKLQASDEGGTRTRNLMLRRHLLLSNWATPSWIAEAEGFEPSRPFTVWHVSGVLVSTTHPYFPCFDDAKIERVNATFFRSTKNFIKSLWIIGLFC